MALKIESQSNFINELCKYYMEFLKDGFKSNRFPKRYIRLNEKNYKTGIDLSKYEKFNTFIKKLVNKDTNFQNPITIKKGEYSVQLNNTAQDLIRKLVKKIDEKDIEKIVNLANKTVKEFSISHRNKADEAYDQIVDIIKKDLTKIIIQPISEKIEPLIGSQSNFELESLWTVEQNISELILDPLVEGIPSIFNDILADKKNKPKEQIAELFNKKDIANSLLNYFENIQVKDLYYDLQEIVNSRKNLDKKEIYLYFSEIEIEKKRFPLFYMQLEIKEFSSESKFEVSFSNELFVNKNAIKYSFDVLKKDQKLVEIFNEERKIYISEQENLCEKLNNIINSIIPKLRLEGNINLSNPTAQISKSINFVISNNSSICVFDKSDEALINDFEDILSKISEGEDSEVVELFKSIITDFLMNEPEVINENLEDSWDGMSVNERLNYTSPIPLNPEQLKILKALKDPKCKYVVVEGPPGTGKSHTISAIAFDYVLNEKSILILSDTREALDVVENKINNTLNKVRGKDPLQNPILRLGKMGNTYNKILAKSSIDNIRTFHRAQKNGINEIDKDIKDISDVINDRVKIETDHYQYIDKEKLEEFSEIQKLVSPSDLFIDPIALKENIKKLDISIANEDLNLNIFIDRLFEIEEIEDLTENFKDLWAGKKDLESFINYLEHLKIINDYINNKNSNLKSLHFFQKPFAKNLLKLKPIIDEFEEMKSSFLGTMLKGDRIVHLSNQAKSIVGIKKNVNLKLDDDKIKIVYQEYEELRLLCKKSSEFELLDFDKICKIILNCEKFETIKDFCKKTLKYEIFLKVLLKDILNTKNVSINPKNIDSIFKNIFAQIGSEKKEAIKKYYEMEEFFSNSFNIKERFDYTSLMEKLQSLNTSKMTNILDERIIKFYDTNRNNATTLSKIIKSKQKFPKNQFSKLKNAFPCIISSVRDFAEYIQLDKDMFDLIIIDEASQVSIAQAFPALIRAKKILVLGDKKQFSNLQSYQAATLVNNARLNDLRKVFKANISKESDALTRLESFNVKTSILDFFQSIANFDTRLKKHFRGYPEHIEYCSKTFYNSDLQAIRMRIKPINEVIKFEYLDFSNEEEGNFNKKETEVIIKHLEKMKEKKIIQSVGIITPFSDQQKYLTTQISKHPDRDYFFEKMKLKIMTFDTCQGEEREVVFYSMVACNKRNKLNTIFPVDLSNKDLEETGDKKAQRLNVGFSRVQETMHIIHSRPLDKIDGEIGNALRFIKNLSAEEKLPSKSELDPNSPMEIKVLEWFKKTNFYLENKKNVELKAQFEIGKYLKQLDSDYSHPKFVTDFLVIFSTEDGPKQVIIEYDGLKDHFDNQELITDENFDEFYTTQHYEREKALETYGYNFIRLNKFNTTDDPVKFLDKKLKEVFSKKEKLNLSQYKILESVTKSKLGEEKFCERCNEQKSLNEFKDRTLRTGVGVVCRTCKGINGPAPKGKIQKNENKFKQSKVKYKLVEGNIYEISYVNASGWASKRQITVKSVDQKFVKAFDSITHENRTFRKDRIKDSKKL
jgi:superfamily I DNA and/or RNA helicase